MAVMPGAHYLNAAQGSLMSRFDIVCIHTIVGYAPANAAHFSTPASGYLWQSRDTRYRSAANLNGNPRVIAIENEDHGPAYGAWSGSNVPRFTAAQIETIAKVLAWAYRTHGIPLVLCPDSRPGSRGIAYHRQGCDGNFAPFAYGGRVSGGELWSSSTGKVCPGDRRITQLITQIIPRARVLAGLQAEGDDVAVEDVEKMMWKGGPVTGAVAEDTLIARVRDLENMVWAGGPVLGAIAPDSLAGRVQMLGARQAEGNATLSSVAAKVEQLSLSGVDVNALAAALRPLLPTVAQLADELDRRARDGDPTTGPVS